MVDFESTSSFIFGSIANVSRASDTIALLAGALSIEAKSAATVSPTPLLANTVAIAAVKVVFPWDTVIDFIVLLI